MLNNVNSNDIIISHHLPSYKSIADKFIRSKLNCFFVSDCEKEIIEKQPKLWFHGHTHSECDYYINNIHILCNPVGYPTERNDYKWKIIEV